MNGALHYPKAALKNLITFLTMTMTVTVKKVQKLRKLQRPPLSQNPSPPREFMCGYTTLIVAAAATIASVAVPPSLRIAMPASVAVLCGAVNAISDCFIFPLVEVNRYFNQ